MVRQLGQVSYNTFVKGLITEAGPLTFPDNATIEDMNCVLTLKGSHRRRYGISEEADGKALIDSSYSNIKDGRIRTFLWESVNTKGDKNYLVVVDGTSLLFFSLEKDSNIFYNRPFLKYDISSFIVNEEEYKKSSCSFTSGKGYLFVGGLGVEPFALEYKEKENRIEATLLSLEVRDTKGVDDGLSVETRPLTNSPLHLYNLLNQGWLYPDSIPAVVEKGSFTCNLKCGNYQDTYGAVDYIDVTVAFYVKGLLVGSAVLRSEPYQGNRIYQYISQQRLADAFNRMPATYKLGLVASVNVPTTDIYTATIFFQTKESAAQNVKVELKMNWSFKGDKHYSFHEHAYLKNTATSSDYYGEETPYKEYFASQGVYPSNTQQWFVGREVENKINIQEVSSFDFGTQAAPKGRLFLRVFENNRSSYVAAVPDEPDTVRLSDICFHGGRVFYLRPHELLYSQVLQDLSYASKCYQEGDPTSEDSFDLVDTDGGVIQVGSLGTGVALFEASNGVILFGNNGVWQITGLSDDEGFKATSFAVKRLSNIGCISKDSLIDVEGSPFFLSASGVYTVQKNEYGLLSVISLSANTIQSLYEDIPLHNLQNAIGVYDRGCQKLYWFYDITSEDDVVPNRYTRGLVYDLRLQAFYEMSFTATPSYPNICSSFNTPWLEGISFDQEVLDNENELVLDNEGEIVYTKIDIPNSSLTNVKFLAYYEDPVRFSVCSFNDTSFTDWATSTREGVPYESYFTTGYNIAGESDSKKDIVYLTTQLSRTEDAYDETSLANRSSCQMQIRWDYENTSYSGKWTNPVQIYRANRLFAPTLEDPNFDHRGLPVVTTKHKVRGNGRAIQIKFTSEPGKNFEVLGWSMILGNRK